MCIIISWDCSSWLAEIASTCVCVHVCTQLIWVQSAEGACPAADWKRNSEEVKSSANVKLLASVGVDIYWGISFRKRRGWWRRKRSTPPCILVVAGSFLYLQHAYRQDLTRHPHLALKDQRLLHSKEWEDILCSTTLLSLWLLSKGGSSNGVSGDVSTCPQESKLKHLTPPVYKLCAMYTIHARVGHCHEKLCGKGKDEFW